jgi:CBS domain-containing protein
LPKEVSFLRGVKMDEKTGECQPAITAETLMTTKVHCVTAEMKVSEAIGLLLTHRIRGAPVVDTLRKVISEITEADLLKLATKGLNKTVGTCLESLPSFADLDTLKRTAPFAHLYREFLTKEINRIIIVDDSARLQGIVSRSDILRVLYRPKTEPAVAAVAAKPEKKKTA